MKESNKPVGLCRMDRAAEMPEGLQQDDKEE